MARVEEDVLWEERKTFAKSLQQCFYEDLDDYIIYKSDERKYLMLNIGYAIYGPPKSANNSNDITDVNYDENAQKVINKIYEKICTCAEVKFYDCQPINYGVVYNIIFPPKKEVNEKRKKVGEKETEYVSHIPIFKIYVEKKRNELWNTIWYIDHSGRVYKSWTDYKKNNKLPECTMVLPKDGSYNPDPYYPSTEEHSTVWLEIMDSPACTPEAKFCKTMDTASTVVGIGTLGLAIASMFTPLAPFVLTSGLAAGSVAGIWSFGRSSHQLADRNNHKESIHVFNKEAFPHYFSMAGTAFGLGAMKGSAIISKAAARGKTINTITKATFNTIQGGNIVLNGVGVAYQGYCMYDKYKTEETICIADALNLVTHLMFFCGSVVKIQFASDIIKNTQGKIINDYKKNLSSKRLRKKFNRTKRTAAENNTCKISENAEVIRYITQRQQLLPNQSVTNNSRILGDTSRNVVWSFEHGSLKVNGTRLLNPIEFVVDVIKSINRNQSIGINIYRNRNSSQNRPNDSTDDPLRNELQASLSEFYSNCPNSNKQLTVSDFDPLLNELNAVNIDDNYSYLLKLFNIAVMLWKNGCEYVHDCLLGIFNFVWHYCKSNLKQWGMNFSRKMPSVSGSIILQKIIFVIFEACEKIGDELYVKVLHKAFKMYNSNSYLRYIN